MQWSFLIEKSRVAPLKFILESSNVQWRNREQKNVKEYLEEARLSFTHLSLRIGALFCKTSSIPI